MSATPIVSIITPSYNRAGFIERALQSVREQNLAEVEHIIVDGGSTDTTLQILKNYPSLKVISEPDRGVYDALNKGIDMSKGEIIGQLNTDDYYEKDILKLIAGTFALDPAIDAVVGGARVFEVDTSGNEKTVALYSSVKPNEFLYRSIVGVPIFNAWFFRKSLFDRIGSYSLDYPIVADRDFLIRCYLGKINICPVDSIFYHYRMHGESLSINSQRSYQIPLRTDTLRLMEKYMHSLLSDSLVRLLTRKHHAWTSLELTASWFRERKMTNVIKVMTSAIGHNPLWLYDVISEGVKRAGNLSEKKHASAR